MSWLAFGARVCALTHLVAATRMVNVKRPDAVKGCFGSCRDFTMIVGGGRDNPPPPSNTFLTDGRYKYEECLGFLTVPPPL